MTSLNNKFDMVNVYDSTTCFDPFTRIKKILFVKNTKVETKHDNHCARLSWTDWRTGAWNESNGFKGVKFP